ncbi:flavodoxin family protein [Lactobacillus rossiae]|uniref:Flavodoxin family protein n=1 Tax=Furfurilactobacillus milii TaxID=2888272 RepID=A0A6N9I103_9LACO|nr:flavodoxin family protein [Furfurilactobacillus milii]
MKTLILVAHPELASSQTQQFLKASAAGLPDVTWHHLDAITTPDVAAERELLVEADRIIFQFPLYWYNVPASLNAWMAAVLTSPFIAGAGQSEQPLAGKTVGVVVNTGMPAKAFQAGGEVGFTLDALLTPLRALAQMAGMKWQPIFAINQFANFRDAEQQKLLVAYQRYLTQPTPDTLSSRLAWFEQRLQALVAKLPANQQQQGQLILSTLQQDQADYADLKATVAMLKEGSDDLG